MRHLESLGIEWQSRSLLDMGCGVGYFSDFFSKKGCLVHFADARPSNVEETKKRIPKASHHFFDIEKDKIETLGSFDIVFCYGLLYHLENPWSAIAKLSKACRQMLLIETIVCDHELPLNQLVLETPHSNQALNGIGSRPSPAYIVLALRNAGWSWIYAAKNPPDHPDFHFDWKNNLEYSRNGNNLRCFFLASRSVLNDPELELIPVA
ncbi:MAG TPA: class I SAM-dependent methyltransferase [Candidatus Omnitrophota bacterium]|nr:class I SAM-dependent methyltransferase [Candidatus Omnitrophota bacterium]